MLVTGQFNDAFLPIMDGVTNVVKNYAEWMQKMHGRSYVVTPDFPDYVDREPYTVLRYPSVPIPFRSPYRQGMPSLDARLLHELPRIPFDLVHTHSPFSAGRLALYTARKRGIPIIASFHSKYYDDLYAALKVEAAARYGVRRIVDFYDSVDHVWTVNGGTADTLRAYGFKGHIEIVRNGTDFQPPEDRNALRAQADRELDLDGLFPVFLYVGQMVWQKNLRVLFEALARFKRMGRPFRMLMAGSGYAAEELRVLADTLGIGENVVFLGTVRDRDRLKRLYCRADLFFFPSVYDNASIALREAAACGCPALLVRGANTAEGVVDGENGYLAANDADDMAHKLVEITAHRLGMSQAGHRAMKTIYTGWEEIMQEVNGRYAEIARAGVARKRRILVPISPQRFKGILERRRHKTRSSYRLIHRRITRLVRRIL